MKMKRREFIGLGGAAVAFGAMGFAAKTPAFAQAKLVLKATDVHPLGYPTVEAVVRMGKQLERRPTAASASRCIPSMQLGGEKEMIEQAQVGALAHRPHQRRPDGPDRARAQRLQPALHVPRRRAHGEGDRRRRSATRC